MLRPQLPPTVWDDRTGRTRIPWLIFAAFLVVCNLSHGFLLEVFDRADAELLKFLLTGCVVAEGAILPAWLVWGSGPFWQRLVLHVCLASLLAMLWFASVLPWLSPGDRNNDVPLMLFALPVFSVAISAPLWLMRLFFGWRIVAGDESREAEEKLSIRDFLIGTAIVGGALGSARLAMSFVRLVPQTEFWPRLGIFVGIAAVAAALLELPILWFTFRIKSPLASALASGAIMLVPWMFIISLIAVVDRRTPDVTMLAGMCLFFLSLGYTTAAAFWLARATGYRLEIRLPGSP